MRALEYKYSSSSPDLGRMCRPFRFPQCTSTFASDRTQGKDLLSMLLITLGAFAAGCFPRLVAVRLLWACIG